METPLYGLIGMKLGHSFSKGFFTEKFEALGIQARYELFELPVIGEFKNLLRQYPQLKGLNVTMPYKTATIPFLDGLSEEAHKVGAVNTIQFAQGKLIGHNTDVLGFRRSLQEALGGAKLDSALILGNGGASRAVSYALHSSFGVKSPVVVSRSPNGTQISYAQLNSMDISSYPLIVNTTPLGMYPMTNSFPNIPYYKLQPGQLLFDLVYNPEETLFLQMGRERGTQVQNGIDMLIYQAEEAWSIWNK